MKYGIAYIISNVSGKKHRHIFEELCNKSIKCCREHLNFPIAVLSLGECKKIKADYHIDGQCYLDLYSKNKEETHGLIAAELLKTHIYEWSPFENTLYIDCDAFVMKSCVKDYLSVLELGYELSMSTCISMNWKDSIEETTVNMKVLKNIPQYFPYWNFGIFGSNKNSERLLTRIREEFLTYCFDKSNKFASCVHAQAAVVKAAHALSPDHRIFTMPAKYNCHFSGAGGYVFSGSPVVLHMWKDIRNLIIKD